jgi:hypothetical protein
MQQRTGHFLNELERCLPIGTGATDSLPCLVDSVISIERPLVLAGGGLLARRDPAFLAGRNENALSIWRVTALWDRGTP